MESTDASERFARTPTIWCWNEMRRAKNVLALQWSQSQRHISWLKSDWFQFRFRFRNAFRRIFAPSLFYCLAPRNCNTEVKWLIGHVWGAATHMTRVFVLPKKKKTITPVEGLVLDAHWKCVRKAGQFVGYSAQWRRRRWQAMKSIDSNEVRPECRIVVRGKESDLTMKVASAERGDADTINRQSRTLSTWIASVWPIFPIVAPKNLFFNFIFVCTTHFGPSEFDYRLSELKKSRAKRARAHSSAKEKASWTRRS